MCYAFLVMLRGRCSCAISERPTSPSFATSSLLRPLTPLFPLDARHSPVSPLFPLHAQKQWGYPSAHSLEGPPSGMTSRPISEMPLPGPISVPFASSVLSVSGPCPDPVGMVSFLSAAFSGSPLTPAIPALLATPALRIVPAPICTTTSRIHVGAPTFLSLHTIGRSQKRPASERGPCTSFELLTLNRSSPLSLIIPVHPGNSPVSPMIPVHTQRQGGGAFLCRCDPL